jgi:hypothetical protein
MNDETRWQDVLADSPELRDNPMLADIKSVPDLAKIAVDLKAYQGRSMKLPGDEPTVEEKTAVFNKLKGMIPGLNIMPDVENEEDNKRFWGEIGVPEDIEGYKPPADFEALDEAMMTQLRDISHKAGLTEKQYHNVLQQYSEANSTLVEQNTTAKEEHLAQLKQHWGSAYDDNIQITDAMVSQFQDKDVQLGELNNAARIFMLNVAKSLTSDPQVFKQINDPKPKLTPADLRLELEDIQQRLLDKSITGTRRKTLLKRYEAGFAELEPYTVQ